ncbi:MAG TPA: hypothetical protein VGW31_15705 [Hanamia sp.]|nr:hypothetical protein [Hanamia sp.]
MNERKKVLLLTYYFKPCTYVASNRPNSFAKELVKNNFDVIVITRHWKGTEQVWEDYLLRNNSPAIIEKHDHLTIHRLPYQQTSAVSGGNLFSKFKTLQKLILGNINQDVNYYQFKPYIERLLKSESIDLIIASIPPLNALRLSYELSKKYGKQLYIDVRDYENNIVLSRNIKPGLVDKIKHRFSLYYSMKWFRAASLIFTTTPPITKFISQHSQSNVITIMNGYQERLLNINEKEYDRFHITLMGSLYEIPEFNEMLDGFKLLFQKNFGRQIIMQFIGSNTSPSIVSRLKEVIPSPNLVMRERMAQEKAQKEAAKSHLLLVLGFKNMKGTLGTKPFEYMGLRKTIIQMPGDQDLMEKIILECHAGYCPRTAEEFVEIVEQSFYEWKEKGNLEYHGNMGNIKKYSREEEFKKLLPYLAD